MANKPPLPDYVFRVFSPSLHGMNSINKFEPAAYAAGRQHNAIEQQPGGTSGVSEKLLRALAWKDFPDCPFIFFTRSFLFALVYAGYKAAKEESDVIIACLRAVTATSNDGRAVRFHPVSELVERFNIKLRLNKAGESYDYAHEIAVTTSVILGRGSCYVSYKTLVNNGLYDLYPPLNGPHHRQRPRLNLAMEDLRKFGFGQVHALTKYKVEIAERLALLFAHNGTNPAATEFSETSIHLLAWFLSLQ